eukprot:TRINITY_DN110681_c0_g1_i1.p1 TRINITY_DN110681_c0_g1~~TRINITY_DN110681_c0_g1_i1.p1  ORF type:complete len:547 (+),score=150.68 TRINITY_DN110681_c0_g1_i1:73-1713(+)
MAAMFNAWRGRAIPALAAAAIPAGAMYNSDVLDRIRQRPPQKGAAVCEEAKKKKSSSEVEWRDMTTKIMTPGQQVKLMDISKLSDLGFESRKISNRTAPDVIRNAATGQVLTNLVGDEDCVLMDIVHTTKDLGKDGKVLRALPRGGPRHELHFDPSDVRAAIVCCGGLCPGLNNIIHHIVSTLNSQYGVKTIYGIRGGYRGLGMASEVPVLSANSLRMRQGGSEFGAILLTPDVTKDIQHHGGTCLGSSRGGLSSLADEERIISFLVEHGINQLFVIGGDGTHRGAHKLSQACAKRGLEIAVAGVPKTIDNDIAMLDRSFGFDSAVEAAQDALRSAKTEAMGNMPNGIVVVKLMGRSAGYLAAYATISSSDVDLCLVPEVPIILEGQRNVFSHIESVVQKKGYAVIVVAEGAGEDILGESKEVDAGGNRKLPEIGVFMKQKINEHFKSLGKECQIKYIEPSYMVRSVPANAADSYLCYLVAANAVHGAMFGFTSFTSGMVNNHSVLLPIPAVTEASPRGMNPQGRTWQRVVAITGQPDASNLAKAK